MNKKKRKYLGKQKNIYIINNIVLNINLFKFIYQLEIKK